MASAPWKLAMTGVVVAFLAGVLLTAWLLRAEAPLAFVDPSADVRLTDGHGHVLAVPGDGALHRGERLRAGARGARVSLARGGTLDLAPHSMLLVADPSPRLEGGLAVVDTTTVTREVRIETPSGSLILTSARVDVRAAVVLPSAEPGAGPAVAYLHVEEGRVTLEAESRRLTLESGEGGLLIAGRPPMRQPASDPEPPVAEAAPPDDDDLQEPPAELVPVVVPVPVPVITGGSITGLVDLDGTPPAEQARTPACGGTPAWSVSAGHLANVYVRISSAVPGGGTVPPGQVMLRGCGFAPRVSAFQLGQHVSFLADGVHEVRVVSGVESLFDARLFPDRPPSVWTPSREGTFSLKTDEPEAAGAVAISPHPFFAVSGSDGRFTIPGVPPGHYTVSAWHELGGTRTADVNVTFGRPSELHFQYALPAPAATSLELAPAPAPALAPASPAPAAVVAIAAAEQVEPPRAATGECKIAVGTGSPIAQACGEGGVTMAAGLMKQIVTAARERGMHLRCQACHSDAATYALLPTAREQLQRLLYTPSVTFAFMPHLAAPAKTPPPPQHRPSPRAR